MDQSRGTQGGRAMSTIRERQIRLLDVIGYLMAIIAVVGAVAWS